MLRYLLTLNRLHDHESLWKINIVLMSFLEGFGGQLDSNNGGGKNLSVANIAILYGFPLVPSSKDR